MRRFTSRLFAASMAIILAAPAFASATELAASLRGSPTSMVRQNQVAKKLDYTFVKTTADLMALVDEGEFVPLPGNRYYVIDDGVSHPVARPEVRLFIERLAEQYFDGTGEKLVVTSLTRPISEQPRNSHQLSVHPAGIAVDFRISKRTASRAWLESVLLKLERQGLLDITRERYPPHYHVALFPEAYRSHVAEMVGEDPLARELASYQEPPKKAEPVREAFAAATAPMTAVAAVVTSGSPVQPGWPSLLAIISIFVFVLGVLGIFAQDALRDTIE